jgi:biopolymer transport protein TolR
MRQRRLKNEINVVPYIDVMLVLLVIFMVTAPMMTTGSTIDLPSVGICSDISRINTSKFPSIDDRRCVVCFRYQWESQEKIRAPKELKGELVSLKSSADKTPVLIAGDKETQYKNIIDVLDEVQAGRLSEGCTGNSSK